MVIIFRFQTIFGNNIQVSDHIWFQTIYGKVSDHNGNYSGFRPYMVIIFRFQTIYGNLIFRFQTIYGSFIQVSDHIW